MICPESPRHLAYVCDGIVEVHSEALHQEDPRPRVCLMDSAGCHQSAYSTALMLRPGFPWAWQAWGVEVEGGFPAPQLEAALPRQEAAMIRGTARSQASGRASSTTNYGL